MTLISPSKPHSSAKRGAQGEHFFEGYFLEKGAFIASPKHDHHRVDYVVEWHGQLVRVNVKTLYPVGNHYQCNTRTNCSGNRKRKYLPGEIDYFGIVSLEHGCIWMIPYDVLHRSTIRWHPPYKTHRKRFDSFNWDPYLVNRASTMEDITSLVKLS